MSHERDSVRGWDVMKAATISCALHSRAITSFHFSVLNILVGFISPAQSRVEQRFPEQDEKCSLETN